MLSNSILELINTLPKSAAPFLSFNEDVISPITEIYKHIPVKYADFHYIGSNDSGDPICLNANTHEIWILIHDDNFKKVYVNRNIDDLKKCLELYSAHVESIQKNFGESAFLNFTYPIDMILDLEQRFKLIDERSIQFDSFWGSIFEIDKTNVRSEL